MALSVMLILDQATQASLGVLLAMIACMFYVTFIVARDAKLRSRITSRWWWKLQFASHPLLVGGLVYWHGSENQNAPWAKILLVPIVVNFGVNQRLLPNARFFLYAFTCTTWPRC